MIVRTGEFNVSILDETATFDIFKDFGFRSGRDLNKFEGRDIVRSENGIAYIPNCTSAYISAKVVSSVDLGTHTMFIADVVNAEVLSENESVTYSYYQKNIKPAPQAAEKKIKGYRCVICGYVYEGETLPADFVCPVCKHGASDFVKIEG